VKKVVDNANKAKAAVYTSTSSTTSSVLLNEDFSTQTTKFLGPGEYTDATVAIKDGYYSYKNKSKTGYIYSNKELADFNENKDFIISCKVFISDTSSWGVGIDWGMQGAAEKYFRFEITKDSKNSLEYNIYKSDGGISFLKNWTASSAINEKKWNTLTVRKIKNTYTFYINDTLVHTADFQPLFGKKFGVKIPRNYIGYFDDFVVSYLN
jgi:hypothetical protein